MFLSLVRLRLYLGLWLWMRLLILDIAQQKFTILSNSSYTPFYEVGVQIRISGDDGVEN